MVGGRRKSVSMPCGDSTSPPAIASGERSDIAQARPSTLLAAVAPRFDRRGRLNEPRYKLFWQTVSIAASMVLFASLRPSTTDVTARDTTQSIIFASSPKVLRRTVSERRSQQPGVSKTVETRMGHSDYFVAKDVTNHFNLPAQSTVTVQKSELSRTAQHQ